jgi:hypothetical protein
VVKVFLTKEAEAEIRGSLNEQLRAGQLVSSESIEELRGRFGVDKRAVQMCIDRLQYLVFPTRELGFVIEKKYFQLVDGWNGGMKGLFREVAKQLGIHPSKVAGWINFIHSASRPWSLNKAAPVSEVERERILGLYREYLSFDELPLGSLHGYIAGAIGGGLTKTQVHKVLLDYRRWLRQSKFPKPLKEAEAAGS